MTRFEVQTYSLCGGWENNWMIETAGESYPETFATREEAEAELDLFFKEIEEQIQQGLRNPDEGYDREDFRVVEVLEA